MTNWYSDGFLLLRYEMFQCHENIPLAGLKYYNHAIKHYKLGIMQIGDYAKRLGLYAKCLVLSIFDWWLTRASSWLYVLGPDSRHCKGSMDQSVCHIGSVEFRPLKVIGIFFSYQYLKISDGWVIKITEIAVFHIVFVPGHLMK